MGGEDEDEEDDDEVNAFFQLNLISLMFVHVNKIKYHEPFVMSL